MSYLIIQNKKGAHHNFTRNNYFKKLQFLYVSKNFRKPIKGFWIHKYLHFDMYKSRHVKYFVGRNLE